MSLNAEAFLAAPLNPEAIRRIRTASRVSQAVLAAFPGIGKTTVQQWEQGQKKPSRPALWLLVSVDSSI